MKGFYHWIKVFVVIIGLSACQKNGRFMSHQELSDKDSDEYYIDLSLRNIKFYEASMATIHFSIVSKST